MAQVQIKVVSSDDRTRLYELVPVDMMAAFADTGYGKLIFLEEMVDDAAEVTKALFCRLLGK